MYISCNLSRKNNKIESESQRNYVFSVNFKVVTYPVKIIKLKANHNLSSVYSSSLSVVTYPVKIIKLKANHNYESYEMMILKL